MKAGSSPKYTKSNVRGHRDASHASRRGSPCRQSQEVSLGPNCSRLMGAEVKAKGHPKSVIDDGGAPREAAGGTVQRCNCRAGTSTRCKEPVTWRLTPRQLARPATGQDRTDRARLRLQCCGAAVLQCSELSSGGGRVEARCACACGQGRGCPSGGWAGDTINTNNV